MTVKEVLEQARNLYAAAPSHAPLGTFVDPGMNCVITAIYNTGKCQNTAQMAAENRLMLALDTREWTDIVHYNADHTTEEVLALFDRAIEQVSA